MTMAKQRHEGMALQLEKIKAYGYLEEPQREEISVSAVSYTAYFDNTCFVTKEPVISLSECEKVIAWAEGNWTTNRHYAVPTLDVAVHSLPPLLQWFRRTMDQTISPLLQSQFGHRCLVHDAFVVKYQATSKHRYLPVHVDESTHSIVLALNHGFQGGGTYFVDWDTTLVPSKPGTLVSFRGDTLRHGGNVVTEGVRYILAVFLYKVDAPTFRFRENKRQKFSFGFFPE
eukprot:CAMPEP_0116837578 /NCGR_PEP_ID=MMETSP0418-20121206/8727_1 /TAXON_ID=1158023 /ORGANISM="Astrosyne radiata, Strain 13vi08-1A" /LENGTH=228 /DNA_ID=CAMNT_0004467469 /DNA_START=63 /DNA_END=749 /DNA_ORIENTATION=-